jgi:tetratricopeptide (TPR) repeat protein
MRKFHGVCLILAIGYWHGWEPAAHGEISQSALEALRQVDREGKGNRTAKDAWAELTAGANADQLPALLAAMDGAGPLAANWLRAAVDTVAERHMRQHGKLLTSPLEKFLSEKQHDQRARRLAYEWILRNDPTAADRLIPTMLDDPSLELRRDAVARVLAEAERAEADKKADAALAAYRKALEAARDLDQVKVVTEALKKAGQGVDLPRHFGFLQDWQIIGPFDNRQGKGFSPALEPEARFDPKATYVGIDGAKVAWNTHHTDDPYGLVDLNKAIGKHMGAVAYAAAEFQCPIAQSVELRLGTESANKIWLNGKLLFSAEVYHANGTMDQYVGRGELKAGRNLILLKICQNEQTDAWAQDWKFQLRVCDASGKAVLATDRPAPRPLESPTAALNKE